MMTPYVQTDVLLILEQDHFKIYVAITFEIEPAENSFCFPLNLVHALTQL